MLSPLIPAHTFLLKFLLLLSFFKLSLEQPSVGSTSQQETNPNVSIRIVGEPVSVWSSVETWKKCKQIDVPDIPARAFVVGSTGSSSTTSNNNASQSIRIIDGAVGYREMSGPTLLNQTRSCNIAWNASRNPDPSMFAGNEFIDSTVRFENGTVVALVHTEFPGDRYNACDAASSGGGGTFQSMHPHEYFRTGASRHGFDRRSRQKPLTYPTCWMVSIGLVVSRDFGMTWSYVAKPPHHLVAAVPYKYNQSQLAYGWGDPSSIVRSPIHCSDNNAETFTSEEDGAINKTVQNEEDCYYYMAMFNRNRVGEQPPGICMSRTKDLLDPKSWRAWNGTDFTVRFANPYSPPNQDTFDPKDHVCQTISPPGIPDGDCIMLGLVWSEYLHKFVGTFGCLVGQSFYFSTSTDLIHWSPVQEFYNRDKDLPPDVRSKTTSIAYPSLLDPNGGPNFQNIGRNPYLFWASFGHSPYTDGRNLWATRINLDIEDNKTGLKDVS